MFGTNEITTQFQKENGELLVHKVFYTIQGEGPDAGRPAIFVRLSKCNLRCWYCDTEFETGEKKTLAEITEIVAYVSREQHCNLVVLTGGEPLLQNVLPFVDAVNRMGISVSIETAGTSMLKDIWRLFSATRSIADNLIVCSPKTGRIAGELEPYVGAWKYVVKAGEQDEYGLPMGSTQMKGKVARVFRPSMPCVPIYINPMDEYDAEKNQANLNAVASTCLKHGYRMGVQIHKLANLE